MKYIAILFCVLGLTIAGCGGDKASATKSGKSDAKSKSSAPTTSKSASKTN